MEFAQKVGFFQALTPQGLPLRTAERLAEISLPRGMARGETLFLQGAAIHHVYCVASGRVRLMHSHPSGVEMLHTVMKSGDLFSDIATLASAPHLYNAVCAQKGQLLLLPAEEFRQVAAQDLALSSYLLQKVSVRLYEMFDLMEEHHLLDVACRLARKLLVLARKFGVHGEAGVAIDLHLTQEDLAMMIGATRQSVGTHLVKWQRCGWIRQKYGRIEIVAMEQLREVAGTDGGELAVWSAPRAPSSPVSAQRDVSYS